MIKVMGIDPGLAETGVGIVSGRGLKIAKYAYGSIETSKSVPTPQRLDRIFSRLLGLLESETPDLMVVEDVFSLREYPKSGIMLGKVVGVILLAGCRARVPVSEIAVREAKQVLTGNGNAGKEQLERSVRHFLRLQNPIRPYHASDALALALIGLYRQRPGKIGCPNPV